MAVRILPLRFQTPPLIRKRSDSFVSRISSSATSITFSDSPPVLLYPSSKLIVSTHANMPWEVSHPSSKPVISAGEMMPSEAPQQRSKEWFALRKNRLTTSTFSTALGFWKAPRRAELWQEKVFPSHGIAVGSAAKAAMEWGTTHESGAIEQFKSITGREVGTLGFAVHAEERYGWLGSSPDGILGKQPDGGILEVKCPYNKGKPELALPWQSAPYYYMPQIQGQMEIMNRNWVDLYCWTPNGSTLIRVFRSREYWEVMHEILHNFWWGCVLPAREAVSSGRVDEANIYRPEPRHELTGGLISRSRRLAAESKLIWRELGGHLEFYN